MLTYMGLVNNASVHYRAIQWQEKHYTDIPLGFGIISSQRDQT